MLPGLKFCKSNTLFFFFNGYKIVNKINSLLSYLQLEVASSWPMNSPSSSSAATSCFQHLALLGLEMPTGLHAVCFPFGVNKGKYEIETKYLRKLNWDILVLSHTTAAHVPTYEHCLGFGWWVLGAVFHPWAFLPCQTQLPGWIQKVQGLWQPEQLLGAH